MPYNKTKRNMLNINIIFKYRVGKQQVRYLKTYLLNIHIKMTNGRKDRHVVIRCYKNENICQMLLVTIFNLAVLSTGVKSNVDKSNISKICNSCIC